ncbi:MAG: DUF1684 domain-containing protein [Candidatus Eisenbacteria bacterium]
MKGGRRPGFGVVLVAALIAAGTGAGAGVAATRAGAKLRAARPATLTGGERDSLAAAYLADRNDTEKSMRTNPQSSLGAFARADFGPEARWLVIGSAPTANLQLDDGSVRPQHVKVQVEGTGFRVEALDPGATFVAYGVGGRDTTAASVAPSWIGVGRYRVRLSYQNSPALIAVDPDLPARAAWPGNAWWPVDLAYRYVVELEPDNQPDTVRIESTNGPPRPSLRVGWFAFEVRGKRQRLAALRLLEPGVGESDLSVFFRDATSGKGSYGMGRYVDPERRPDGRWVLDFNLAYNPACAVSPYYNCPLPPQENELKAAIKAGEAYHGEGHP